MSRVWNPHKSNLLDNTLNKLAEMVDNGEISSDLRPTTLIALGGDFKYLYFAALTPRCKSKWAIDFFPDRFQSFIEKVNEKCNSQTVNVKRNFVSHTRDELSHILSMRELFLQGEYTKDEAITALNSDYSIPLSIFQENLYFSNGTINHRPDISDSDKLVRKIKNVKKLLELDFSNLDCVKGLMFESLVGVYLAEKNGIDEHFESQKRFPVAYKDLSGKAHASVFLDYLVDGQIYEVKWENNFENIIDSILPQVYALEKKTNQEEKAVVICKTKNPEIQSQHLEDIFLLKESVDMGLEELGSRRMNDVFDYISFEDLISDDENEELYKEILETIDSLNTENSVDLMKNYTTALTRLYKNGENIPEKLSKLLKLMNEKKKISNDEVNEIVGTLKQEIRENEDIEKRIEMIEGSTKKNETKLILDTYNLKYGTDYKTVTDEIVTQLLSLPKDEFEDTCLDLYIEKENKRQERLNHRMDKRKGRVERIIEAQSKALKRKTHDEKTKANMIYHQILYVMNYPVLEKMNDEFIKIDLNLKDAKENLTNKVHYFLVKKKLWGKKKPYQNHVVTMVRNMNNTYDYIQEAIQNLFSDAMEYINHELQQDIPSYERMPEFIEQLNKIAEKAEQKIKAAKIKFQSNPYLNAIRKAWEQIESGKININDKSIESMIGSTVLSGKFRKEKYQIKTITTFANLVNMINEIDSKRAVDFFTSIVNNGKTGTILHQYGMTWLRCSSAVHISNILAESKIAGETISNINDLIDNKNSREEYISNLFGEISSGLEMISPFRWDPKIIDYQNMISLHNNGIKKLNIENLGKINHILTDIHPHLAYVRHLGMEYILHAAKKNDSNAKNQDEKVNLGDSKAIREFVKKEIQGTYNAINKKSGFQHLLISDYYKQKIFNIKCLSHINSEKAIEYANQNLIEPQEKDIKIFAKYVTDLSSRDQKLFASYIQKVREAA